MKVEYKIGDCLEVLQEFPDDHFDSCVTDPPYGLEIMHRTWDKVEVQKFSGEWGKAVYRVLKPGAHLLAFCGGRTYHRMVCGLEDEGFKIKGKIDWIYAQGRPNSRKSLKPAHESIVVAKRPGTSSIDFTTWKDNNAQDCWPSDVLVDDIFDQTFQFFYIPKPTTQERDKGLLRLPLCETPGILEGRVDGSLGHVTEPRRNFHPCVKPLKLMRHLVKLVTPKDGICLDPFLGSGTTLLACRLEGFNGFGIEKEPTYESIIRERLAYTPPALDSFDEPNHIEAHANGGGKADEIPRTS